MVIELIPSASLSIATQKAVDSRSYKVDFELFEKMAPNIYQPKYDAKKSILDIISCVKKLDIPNDFRSSPNFIRLKSLEKKIKNNLIDGNLYKIFK